MWCESVSNRTFIAALIDWAEYQREQFGVPVNPKEIRQLKKRWGNEKPLFCRAVWHSIERGCFSLQLDPCDFDNAKLREENFILRAATDLGRRVA